MTSSVDVLFTNPHYISINIVLVKISRLRFIKFIYFIIVRDARFEQRRVYVSRINRFITLELKKNHIHFPIKFNFMNNYSFMHN